MRVRLLGIAFGVLTALAVTAAPASAGVGISASLNWSGGTVGTTGLPASVTITNTNSPPNNAESNALTQLRVALSCGTTGTVANLCPSPDPGVFSISSTATGRAGSACAGVIFSVSAPDASGVVTFTPSGGPVVIPPPGGTNQCTVDFTVGILKVPTIDAAPGTPGLQTRVNALVTLQGVTSGLVVNALPTVLITVVPRPHHAVADFDGNGTTDRSVYRNGAWYVQNQTTVFLGLAGYLPVPADYDGDGDTDKAVYKDGAWYIQGQATTFLGLAGYIPVPGDYDGDGDADRAVYDPASGAWYIAGQATVFLGGAPGDIPVPGDYDGDGDTEPAVYRNGAWYVQNQPTVFLGLAGYIPVPGDYDGDGDTDRAVFKNGAWYVQNQATVSFGLAGDIPVPGDYDGDGDTDRAVYRNGAWYVQDQATEFFGLAGDIPLPLPQAIYQASFGGA
ncbi:MAG: hypothetical protein QOG42_144 [Solirubrobacteraceae bacterium]|jgi:hypothetical protein|nr:hypothetical protein [Solirubrobacteraceae bacterium]